LCRTPPLPSVTAPPSHLTKGRACRSTCRVVRKHDLPASRPRHAHVRDPHPVHLHISMFQSVVLGVLQGLSELFPVSSLATPCSSHPLRLALGGGGPVDPESSWLAFVVMLHVGSAVGLLIFFWRDWIAIIRAWCHTLVTRRIETSPNGWRGSSWWPASRPGSSASSSSIRCGWHWPSRHGPLLSHPERLHPPRAERLRRRTAVRDIAVRQGAKQDGGRRLETLDYKEALVIGVAQSSS